MTKELKITNYELTQTSQMVEMSKVLKKHILDNKLYTTIRNKNYAHVEGWQFAGGLIGLYPRVASVENLSNEKEIKWKAEVEIVKLADDKVVGRGFAICSNTESKKKEFEEFAILSMAQTRAVGKAYRNLIGWVMKLAGYQPTPAEEMEEKMAEIDNEKAFNDILEKIKKLDKEKQKQAAEKMLKTPPFELTDKQKETLETICM